jgi:general secretion pathway protein D
MSESGTPEPKAMDGLFRSIFEIENSNEPMCKPKHRFVAFPLAALLGMSGCESLGPDPAKRLELPSNLVIDRKKGGDERPLQSEPLTQEPTRPPEYYPATGSLVGPGGPSAERGGGAYERGGPRKEGKYTLNFDDADLAEVAKTILDETLKINYVLSPKVSGKVTLQTTRPLAEDELIPTLEMLLRMNGAVLIKDKDVYRIEPDATAIVDAPGAKLGAPGQGLPPGYQLRVVPLRYVGVQEMQKVLEPLMPPKAVVRADETRNMLMLAGSQEELEAVLETIRLFDVDFMRGKSVAIFPLKSVEPQLIAEELDKVLGDTAKGPLAGVVKLMPIERLNAILAVTTQPRYLDEVETWIERLDRYTTHRAGGVHVYRVQNVDALELANTLSNIFGGTGTAGGRGRPSLTPGAQGSTIGGGAFGTGGAFGGTGSTGGGVTSPSGDLGYGSGSTSGFGSSGTMGGSSFGSSGSSMGGLGGSTGSTTGGLGTSSSMGRTGGLGGGMGGGGFGGGIGRGTSGQRQRTSAAADLGNARIVADPANNALIITARAQDYKEIEAVIKELDVLPLQVLIDATIAEVQLTDNLQYGIKWYFQQGSSAETLFGRSIDLDQAVGAAAAGTGFSYALVAKDVRVLLTAQADKNKVNVLSSPSLMVLNNQEATIKVGDQVPILTGQYGNFTGTGTTPITGNPVYSSFNSVQYRDTGVLLTVRPRVNSGGLVIMDLEQAVDDVKTQTSGEINSPTITQRQIKSSVAVANGETLVLGGLIKDQTTNNRSGIPLLHDLPVIGDLFGQTTKNLNRTELVVLLTPRVLESRARARDITNEFRRKLTGLYQPAPLPPPAR